MNIVSQKGRTSVVYRTQQGLVCKSPQPGGSERFRTDVANQFAVEKQLLERLGNHPWIVKYYGPSTIKGMEEGLLLGEANCGDLQSYIDRYNSEIDNNLRREWCLQLTEAIDYLHKNGIIHSNISTTNVLIHQIGKTKNLLLADFGGSKCKDLGLNGHMLPDDPFFDPHITDFTSPKVDIYSLGIMIYIISTGHYPFHEGPPPQGKEREAYEDFVHEQFRQNKFPDLSNMLFRDIISGCCCERRFETAEEVVIALKAVP
ncbi:kinase-like domain-containing protein [Phaeosphaeria sp. MPI-PUGE-AT-0046c]|nr:kinase-like domain-containing protein [Phaeosphaeria sp. MPI-PUGE-AT-0046c]